MSKHDAFGRLLASLHEASLDDSRWPAASALIDEACGTKGSALVVGTGHSQADCRILFTRFCRRGRRDEECERWYFDNYFPIDERIARLPPLPDGRLVPIPSLYTQEELKSSAAYNEALLRGGYQNGLNVRLDGPGGSHVVWTLADSVQPGGWGSAQCETVRGILPHLRHFVRTRAALEHARLQAATLGDMLDSAGMGVVQLERDGRIREANDCARDILQGDKGLSEKDGFLQARLGKDDANFKRVLAGALPIPEGPASGGSLTVRRSPGLSPLMVHVHPAVADSPALGATHEGALVLIVPAEDEPVGSPYDVAAALGLTLSEAGIASQLAQGRTVREIADALDSSVHGVRWTIRRIFLKQGITRQAELVRLVLSVSTEAQPPQA